MKRLYVLVSIVFSIALFSLCVKNVEAKNLKNIFLGEISGKIFDEFDEPLIGATVVIKGTTNGTITNINGQFSLGNVPLGQQVLLISFIGYATTEITVDVQEGILVTVNHKMEPAAQQLEGVVITAKADIRYSSLRSSTDLQLVNSIKYSEGVMVGVSNEQILKSVDRDASQIVKRIAGVSLVDRFAVVRGMDPRYNLTLVNGIVGPSSEEYSRSFSFDALPSRVIDRIEVDKSPGPHLPAMWGGGVIKMFTKSFTTSRQLNISFSGASRSGGSSFTNNFITYDTPGSGDWLANGADDRRVPALLRQKSFVFPDASQYPTENIAISRAGLQTFTPKAMSHDVDKRASLTYYDNWNIGGITLNSLSAISYTQERQFRKVDQRRGAGFFQFQNNPEATIDSVREVEAVQNSNGDLFFKLLPSNVFKDSVYEEQIRIAAVQSLGVEFNENANIRTTLFYNRFGTDNVTIRTGVDGNDAIIPYKDYIYEYTQREILLGQLGGYNKFGEHSIDWIIGASLTRNDVPDFQRFRFVKNNQAEEGEYQIFTGLSNDRLNSFQTHLVFETEEKSVTGRIDYRKDFGENKYVRAGIYYDRKERSFFSHRYSVDNIPLFNASGNGRTDLISRPWLVIDSIYRPENFNVGQWSLSRPASQAGTYFFDDDDREAYVALNYPLMDDKLSVYGGLRYARFDRTLYDQFNVPVLATARINNESVDLPAQVQTYYLPSVMFKYAAPSGKQVVRLVFGQTIDRPQFREQAGASGSSPNDQLQRYDFSQNIVFIGNPALKNSRITNTDLRFELYPKSGEFISVGAFHKYLQDPIQRLADEPNLETDVVAIKYDNGTQGNVLGFEFELRKKFDFLKIPIIRNMSVNMNGSYIWSEVEYLFQGVTPRKVPLQGASDFLLNTALYFEDLEKGTLVSVIYNYIGDRVREYSNNSRIGLLYEARRSQLDLVFKQRLSKFATVKFGIQDILNQERQFYRDQNLDERLNPGVGTAIDLGAETFTSDFVTESFRPGTYFSLGFSFDLTGKSRNKKKKSTETSPEEKQEDNDQ